MANVKISDLTPASGVADANEFEINESGSSKKVTGSQISSYVRGDIVTADISDVTITATELEYLDGVTSPIQGQINGKANVSHTHSISDVTGLQTELDDKVGQTSSTGSAELPSGTTAQRDGTPSAGYLRFNSTEGAFEGYDGSAWGALGGDGIGVDQTWQDVTASRSAGTTYQNTTGKPIQVFIVNNAGNLEVSVNGSSFITLGVLGNDYGTSATIPNNYYYRASSGSGGTRFQWRELR